jgi:hypothetical protein
VREAKRQEVEKLQHTFRTVGEEGATTKLEKENKAKATIKRERWNLDQLNREIGDRLALRDRSAGIADGIPPCRGPRPVLHSRAPTIDRFDAFDSTLDISLGKLGLRHRRLVQRSGLLNAP